MTNVLYQHGTLGTLMAGLLEGTATINELLEHGNLGIATLTGSDGEVIFLDGKAYHANEHKEFIELKGDEKVPYASITNFKASKTRRQPEEKRQDIRGAIVGFFTPELFHGVGSAGFHIHFADDERAYGGHVLDFEVDDVVVEIQNFETFQQHFPVNNETFVKAKIDYKDVAEEIREAE